MRMRLTTPHNTQHINTYQRGLWLLRHAGEDSLWYLVAGVCATAMLAAVVATLLLPVPAGVNGWALSFSAGGLVYWWIFWAPRMVGVGRVLADNGMPQVRATVLMALALNAGLTIVLPSVLMALAGAPLLLTLALMLLIAGSSLLLGLIPGVLAWCLFVLIMLTLQWRLFDPVTLAWAELTHWLVLAALAIAALALWRSLRLLQTNQPLGQGRWVPYGVGQVRLSSQNAVQGMGLIQGHAHNSPLAQLLHTRAKVKVNSAVGSIRTCLGQPFAPLSWMQRLRQVLAITAWALLFPLMMLLSGQSGGNFATAMLMFALPFALIALVAIFSAALRQRRRHRHEFAELALLPGIGTDGKRSLLTAVLAPQIVAYLLLLLLVGALGFAAPHGKLAFQLPLLFVPVIASASLGIGCSLAVLTGSIPRVLLFGLALTSAVMLITSFVVPLQRYASAASDAYQYSLYAYLASAAVLTSVGLWLSKRGVSALQARPHGYVLD